MGKIKIAVGIGLVLFALVTILLWANGINASTALTLSNYGPPTRIPQGGTGGTDTEPDSAMGQGLSEMQELSGHGAEQSKQAFAAAVASLPFTPHLITNLPKGFELFHVDANLDGADKIASFGAYYIKQLPSGRIDLHTFQTNDPTEPKPVPSAQLNWAETKQSEIGGKSWKYILLVHPQPDGSEVKLHYISRVFDDGVRVVVDIKGNAPSEELLEMLKNVALSLQ